MGIAINSQMFSFGFRVPVDPAGTPTPGGFQKIFEAVSKSTTSTGDYDPSRVWPEGTEIWPPYTGPQFYMVFPPGYPSDLRDRLKAMYQDPATDKPQFEGMYNSMFLPSEMRMGDTSGRPNQWTSSWETTLARTLKASFGALGGVDPAYRQSALEQLRLAGQLLSGAFQTWDILPAVLRSPVVVAAKAHDGSGHGHPSAPLDSASWNLWRLS
jgi:hypothetical protein